MSISIKLEEAAITILSLYFLSQYSLGLSVWIWILLFFSPDIAMLGYLFGTKTGAFTYNIVHHRGIALVVLGTGIFSQHQIWISIGLLLFAHASFDRMLGYGLKYKDSFKNTHLGPL